eukprot:1152336-Rhodomonas_salina.3
MLMRGQVGRCCLEQKRKPLSARSCSGARARVSHVHSDRAPQGAAHARTLNTPRNQRHAPAIPGPETRLRAIDLRVSHKASASSR